MKLFEIVPQDIVSHIVWHPGIGDDSWVSWIIVGVYYGIALLALIFHIQGRRELGETGGKSQFYFWLAMLLGALGIARHMGLLRWFTELGRALAREQGWYWQRTATQQEIIQSFYYGCGLLFLLLIWLNRHTIVRYGAVLIGVVMLIGFLAIRSVSLHSVDAMLNYRQILGVRWGTAFEIGSLLWIGIMLLLPSLLHRYSASAQR